MFEAAVRRKPEIAGAQFAADEMLQSGLTLQQLAQQISAEILPVITPASKPRVLLCTFSVNPFKDALQTP